MAHRDLMSHPLYTTCNEETSYRQLVFQGAASLVPLAIIPLFIHVKKQRQTQSRHNVQMLFAFPRAVLLINGKQKRQQRAFISLLLKSLFFPRCRIFAFPNFYSHPESHTTFDV